MAYSPGLYAKRRHCGRAKLLSPCRARPPWLSPGACPNDRPPGQGDALGGAPGDTRSGSSAPRFENGGARRPRNGGRSWSTQQGPRGGSTAPAFACCLPLRNLPPGQRLAGAAPWTRPTVRPPRTASHRRSPPASRCLWGALQSESNAARTRGCRHTAICTHIPRSRHRPRERCAWVRQCAETITFSGADNECESLATT